MPYIWTESGKQQPHNVAFKKNDISYPSNWIILATEEERVALGLEWVNDDRPRNKERYYNVKGSRGDWTLEPKDLDELKARAVASCKKTAGNLLSPTDWMVIRKMDSGAAIPEDVAAYRESVRAYSEELESEINAAEFEGIQKIKPEWPSE